MFGFSLKARQLLVFVLTAPLLAVAQTAPPAAAAPIKIAMIESLSGPFANTGEAVFRKLPLAL